MPLPLLRQLARTKAASRSLGTLSEKTITAVLLDLADLLIKESKTILRANGKDCARMNESDPRYDRLLLTMERLKGIASETRTVAGLPSPLRRVLEERKRPNGLHIKKVTVPLGVIGIIYEARPNVTVDTFALCFKAGNAVVLKGGSDAKDSNAAIVRLIRSVLKKHRVNEHAILLLPPDRQAVETMLKAVDMIDVIIPRGSQSLIDFVRKTSSIPVIETGAGIVHTYVDVSGDTKKAAAIVFNAKTRRPAVCNALDTLIIHQSKLKDLPTIVKPLLAKNVEIFADKSAYQALKSSYDPKLLKLATAKHFGTEFLSLRLSIKTVKNQDEALKHIDQFSSKHSEAIIAEDQKIIQRFLSEVDAAAVYANASTAFTDGAQFGMGAEIGISTQKLHARGPMGLQELTSYKWIVEGEGQTRQ
ncbi:MAG: glutamate-5-semialdehyde dehydrogenase [Candidatus Peribacteraceae bacterium]|nr:glutamate-5-semialdehyde dehydrogenase [Candidatus Peribacteraceae bacterium]